MKSTIPRPTPAPRAASIAREARRAACFDVIVDDAPRLAAMHCPADRSPPCDESACADLAGAACDVDAWREHVPAHGVIEHGDGRTEARWYGDASMAMWRRFGAPRVRRGLPPWCSRMDVIVYGAARAYRAAHAWDEAREALEILRAPWPPAVTLSECGASPSP